MFWPGTLLLTAVALPLVRIVPVASAGTVYSVTVIEPVFTLCGSTLIV